LMILSEFQPDTRIVKEIWKENCQKVECRY
jgi:hypothetical protein